MPELPEVETICRGLRGKIIGDTIVGAQVMRAETIAYPRAAQFVKAVVGHSFCAVGRRGKYILIELDRQAGLAIHLRMSGRILLVGKKHSAGAHLRLRLSLASGQELHFEDMRVFGRVWYVPAGSDFAKVIPSIAQLGPEPLVIAGTAFASAPVTMAGIAAKPSVRLLSMAGAIIASANTLVPALKKEDLMRCFKGKKQSIKSALLDQSIIAGIGNIYADESLFRAGIKPLRQAGSLHMPELERLVTAIGAVLARGIERGGTTLRDYTDSDGVNGNYQDDAWVYGRSGKACRICGHKIASVKIAGRTSCYCPKCQR